MRTSSHSGDTCTAYGQSALSSCGSSYRSSAQPWSKLDTEPASGSAGANPCDVECSLSPAQSDQQQVQLFVCGTNSLSSDPPSCNPATRTLPDCDQPPQRLGIVRDVKSSNWGNSLKPLVLLLAQQQQQQQGHKKHMLVKTINSCFCASLITYNELL